MEKAASTSTSTVLKITSAILRIFLNFIFYAAVVWLIVEGGKYTYNFSYQLFGSVSVAEAPGKDYDFTIAKGDSTMEIAKKLEFNNLIVNKYSFYLKTKFKDYNVFPGTYVLNTSMDYDEILTVITDQKNSILKQEVVPENVPENSKDAESKTEATKVPSTDIP